MTTLLRGRHKAILLVAPTESKAIAMRDALFANCDCAGFGAVIGGRGYDRIIVCIGQHMDERVVEFVHHLETKLFPGGTLVVV
jgi:hypothetical protein